MNRRARAASVALPVCAAAALVGCGLGPGPTPGNVRLTITRDFGAGALGQFTRPKVSGSDTAMRLLERNAAVGTRYGGGFVQSVNGVAGSTGKVDWFYYVNGIEASKGGASTKLNAGDHVWWDRHYWGGASDVRAVVGAFPEPFVHGQAGKRYPVRVECDEPSSAACDTVSHQLTGRGIPAARGGLLLAEYNDVLRVLVGRWPRLRDDPAARQLESGPRASGVYARIDPAGRAITTLDERGSPVKTLGPGSGLVAATRFNDQPPVWIVTGTDAAGIAGAARAFEPGALNDTFALAVSQDLGIPLPAR